MSYPRAYIIPSLMRYLSTQPVLPVPMDLTLLMPHGPDIGFTGAKLTGGEGVGHRGTLSSLYLYLKLRLGTEGLTASRRTVP